MQIRIRKFSVLVVTVLTVLVGTVFSACGENQPNNQLTIWSWEIPAKALETNWQDFKQLFPNVNLKIERMEREVLYSRLMQAYLGGGVGLPDIAVLENSRLESFNEKFPNAFLNLNEYAGKYRQDFPATKWAQAEYKNKIRALPWSVAPLALYYRVDLLPASIAEIETWDDFIKLGQSTNKSGKSGGKWLGLDSSSDIFSRALLNQQNSAYFAPDSRINLLAPEIANTFAVLQKLHEADLLQTVNNQTELAGAIKNSSIKAYLASSEFANFLEQEVPEQAGKWRIILPPAISKGGKRIAQIGGLNLTISSKSANSELAWRFLEATLANPATQSKIFRQTGLFPAFLPALKDNLYSKEQPYFGNQAIGQIFNGQVADLTAFNFTENQPKAEKIIIETQQAILSGISYRTAIENAATKLKIETGKEFFVK